ncbi:Gamma-aminobutyrate:alpha-ketoglutarate aminotransferase [Klebsiella pneumoniae]|uniref:Gamma-aminobutyrate:alpha-ketoglutarate aminotransferase n=1 Tax=Klebsiella pneumoniae TaxID=573 RepID=A0A2X3GIP1_KLEPN|nr:Gamma-aminobutyrate:alpha-ketoglutarate aminotransferase [Klebsiella pneumoniae]
MKSSELNQRRQQATPRGVGVMCNYFVEKAENATLWDIEGNEVIDFAAGIAVLNTGHRHPKVVAAVADQLQAFTHTAYSDCAVRKLCFAGGAYQPIWRQLTGRQKRLSSTTGAEAVENAVKIARAYTGRPGLITFGGGFHGRTFMTMALTGKVAPLQNRLRAIPGLGVSRRFTPNAAHGVTTADALKSLERIFKADIAPDQVAAIILEPIQGEGGFNVAPADFMQALRDLCDTHGILLIADEVADRFRPHGKLFAMQHYEVKPDLMTMAKSLAGGFPLSGVVGRAEVMDAPAPGGLGGTYAGNPLAVAAAHAVLDVIAEEQLCQRAEQLGSHLQEVLNQARATCPAIVDVAAGGRWWRWSLTIRKQANRRRNSPALCNRKRRRTACCC